MNELVRVEQPNADVRAYRAATEAADLCKQIVVACSSTIQGRRFVSVEGWQAIAVANGCVLSAREVEKIDGGVRAIGEVRRIADGQVIATGEGFVGEDEPVWFGGGKDRRGNPYPRRADYAIRAMAQTRAMSRAGRTAFAHVVVMMNAGLATTPAEEMVYADAETGEIIDDTPRDPTIPGITKIRNNLNKLRRDGGKATDLEAFNALVSNCADDLTKIKDAHHSLWTGFGEDWDGFRAWIKRRREELSADASTLGFQMLMSAVQVTNSADELRSLLDEHSAAVDELDGEESRRFEEAYNAKEEALKNPTPMTAGAYGG